MTTSKIIQGSAKALALLWGGFWSFFVVATGLTEGVGTLKGALTHGWPAFIFLVTALIALKREAIGGILLIVEGIAVGIAAARFLNGPTSGSTTLMLAGPPIIAGIALLLTAKRSPAAIQE